MSRQRIARIARLHRAAVLEILEVRRLLAVPIIVNTTLDENDANATTSLREAIFAAEATTGDDLIQFDPTVFPNGSLTTIAVRPKQDEVPREMCKASRSAETTRHRFNGRLMGD